MSASLLVLDGLHLRVGDLFSSESDVSITGAQILDLANSRVSFSLYGVSLLETLEISALKCTNTADVDTFRCTQFSRGKTLDMLRGYVAVVADELKV